MARALHGRSPAPSSDKQSSTTRARDRSGRNESSTRGAPQSASSTRTARENGKLFGATRRAADLTPVGPREPRPAQPSAPSEQPRKLWTTLLTTWSQQVDGPGAPGARANSHQPARERTHNQGPLPTHRIHSHNHGSPQSPQPLRTPPEINLISLFFGERASRPEPDWSIRPGDRFLRSPYQPAEESC